MGNKLSDAQFRNEVEKAVRTLQVLRDEIERQVPRARSDIRISEIEGELKWLGIVIDGLTHALRETKVQRWRATQLLLIGAVSVRVLSFAADVLAVEDRLSSAQVSIEQCVALIEGTPPPPDAHDIVQANLEARRQQTASKLQPRRSPRTVQADASGRSVQRGEVTNVDRRDATGEEGVTNPVAGTIHATVTGSPAGLPGQAGTTTIRAQVADLKLEGVPGKVTNLPPVTGTADVVQAPDIAEAYGTSGHAEEEPRTQTIGMPLISSSEEISPPTVADAVARPGTLGLGMTFPAPTPLADKDGDKH